MKLSSIGDVVHALPAAALLRRALPEAKISWIVEKRAAAILEDCPAIDQLIKIDSRAWRQKPLRKASVAQFRSMIRTLSSNFEVAIDFQGLIKSGFIARLSKAGRRIGFEDRDLREKTSKLFLTEQVETSRFGHVIEKNLELARRAIGIGGEAPTQLVAKKEYEFPIAVSEADERYVSARIREIGGRFAIINPGGGWATKLWPADHYSKLAELFWQEHALPSFITFGPNEEALASNVAAMVSSDAARPLSSSLKQFFALARHAAVFAGGDTGPLHLAAAAGAPIVGVFGPTLPARNGPFRPDDIVVGRDIWCRANCHRRSCWHWECMNIPVERVGQAASERLEATSEAVSKR